jgi:rSAM/selenodomain-associated transferase 2
MAPGRSALISVVVPTLNEEEALPETLKRVLAQDVTSQIIVVDGGSDDNTRQVVAEVPEVEWVSASPGRASQMNAGAAQANGDWLLFLHADTWLPAGALQAIANLDIEVGAGGFRQQFSRPHWFLALVSRLHNWRCSRTRVIYGDQALFIRRDLFVQIGCFPDRDELEDVLISERVLAFTRPVLMPQTVITSSRKFEQRGPYRCFFDIVVIMCCYELRLPVLRRAFFSEFR